MFIFNLVKKSFNLVKNWVKKLDKQKNKKTFNLNKKLKKKLMISKKINKKLSVKKLLTQKRVFEKKPMFYRWELK